PAPRSRRIFRLQFGAMKLALAAVMLSWIFYDTSAELIWMLVRRAPLPISPVVALEPFRIANRYGLFAVMTRGRYEIEFQGSNDAQTWTAYPFRYKPQDIDKPPGIYAPLSATIRLEPVVCVTEHMARKRNRAQHRSSPALQRSRRAGALRRQSLSAATAEAGEGCAVAILVHQHEGKARNGSLVAAAVARF